MIVGLGKASLGLKDHAIFGRPLEQEIGHLLGLGRAGGQMGLHCRIRCEMSDEAIVILLRK